jgi:hypothetical protein
MFTFVTECAKLCLLIAGKQIAKALKALYYSQIQNFNYEKDSNCISGFTRNIRTCKL